MCLPDFSRAQRGPCTFLEEGGAPQSPWTPFLPPAMAELPQKGSRTDCGGGGEKKAGFPGNKVPGRSLWQLHVTSGEVTLVGKHFLSMVSGVVHTCSS